MRLHPLILLYTGMGMGLKGAGTHLPTPGLLGPLTQALTHPAPGI